MKKLPRNELQRMYVKEKWSTSEIGRKHGMARQVVNYWLRKHRIPLRSSDEALALAAKKEALRGNSKRPAKSDLKKMYLKLGMSAPDIARQFDVHSSTVYLWLRRERIPIRSMSRAASLWQYRRRAESI